MRDSNFAQNTYTERKKQSVRPQKLRSQFPINNLRHQKNTLASLDTVSSNAGGGPASQSDNLVSTNITSALVTQSNQHKSVETRRKEAE